jgi:hypothetical protein
MKFYYEGGATPGDLDAIMFNPIAFNTVKCRFNERESNEMISLTKLLFTHPPI